MAHTKAVVITTPLTLNASEEKTLLQIIAPGLQAVKVSAWGIFFDEETGDLTPANPLIVKLGKHNISTGTGTSITPKKIQPINVGIQTTALNNFSVAATITDLMDQVIINPQTGFEIIFPLGEEIILEPNESLSINIITGAVISTDGLKATCKIKFEE
jgi:hypothetical protein